MADTYPEWKRLAWAAAISIPVVGAFYAYWSASNYLGLKRLPGYDQAVAENKKFAFNDDAKLQFRVVDLDGYAWWFNLGSFARALLLQTDMMRRLKPQVASLQHLGPGIRMDCTFKQFKEFENALVESFGETDDEAVKKGPLVTFFGSNDYHHLTLGLARRFRQPFNFVIFDNHPDWCELYGIGLHCGSWLNHVSHLPTSKQVFHIGGYSGEFEDSDLRWVTPWKLIQSDKIKVIPASSAFTGPKWDNIPQEPLRPQWHKLASKDRIRELLKPYAEVLAKYPLYITLDKDVLLRTENLQNWNSGVLTREEVIWTIEVLLEYSNNMLLALDITGDFSKVEVAGVYRAFLHKTQHCDSENSIDQDQATWLNQRCNLALLKALAQQLNMDLPQ